MKLKGSVCCVFRIKDGIVTFLGKKYRANYWYSEVTSEDSSYNDGFEPIEQYLNEDRHCGITLFTRRGNAEQYIKTSYEKNLYVMDFDRLCSFLDKKGD